MPYIKQIDRDCLEQPDKLIRNAGELNYSITAQVHDSIGWLPHHMRIRNGMITVQ